MILENGIYHPTYTVKVRKKHARESRSFTVLATPDKTQADIQYLYDKHRRRIGYIIEGETFLNRNVQEFSSSRDKMTMKEALGLRITNNV